MPLALVVAILLTLPFGGSLDQFTLNTQSAVMIGIIPGWITITLAPLLEELAWHGYGTDALAVKWNLWRTTWVFGIFWAFWHMPLSFIQGSYQEEVVEGGVLDTVNFIVSIFFSLIIMNWLYFKSNRNVWVTVVFHLCANVGNEIFQADPSTKWIQTLVLVPFALWILWHERELFFSKTPALTAPTAASVSQA